MSDGSLAKSENAASAQGPDADLAREPRDTPNATHTVAMAQLAGWLLLGLFNQALIVARLPASHGSVRWLHHAYDLAMFLGFGLVSYAAVHAAGPLVRRWPAGSQQRRWFSFLSLFAVALGLGWFIVEEDVSNFAQRLELPLWAVKLVASLLAAGGVASTLLLRSFLTGVSRWLLLPLGIVGATLNAFVLERDYAAAHFMLAWPSALLVGYALEAATRPFAPRSRARSLGVSAAVAVLALAALSLLAQRPRSEVLRRLQSLSSSVGAPLLARLQPAPSGPDVSNVATELIHSPWLAAREGLPPISPTKGLGIKPPRLLVLFTIDSLRADVLNDPALRKQLPALGKLAAESTFFTHARSPSPATNTTFATIFSGRYFTMMSWDLSGTRRNVLRDPTPRFSEVLAGSGVHTTSLPTVARLYAKYNVCRGFETEIQVPRAKQSAKNVMDLVLKQLDGLAEGSTFIFTHFMDAHAPYDSAGRSGTPFERYLRELVLVDEQLARFSEELRQRGLEQDTLIIVTADHGEAFGEHGESHHLKTVYEEVIRVPLLFKVPGQPGRLSDKPVSLVDLGPTILDIYGQPVPPTYLGQSLAPLLVGKDVELTRPLVADAGRGAQALYFEDGKKVILHRVKKTIEVYDLRTDPGELTNLFEVDPAAVDRYVQTASYFFRSIRAKDFEIDDSERE